MAIHSMLTLGKAPGGDLVSIDTQPSGRGGLACPFCGLPLLAVRGQVKVHHFRHEGESCRESRRAHPFIAGWDHFDMSLPPSVVAELLPQKSKHYTPTYRSNNHLALRRRMERHGVFETGYLREQFLTDTALVVPGLLSLSKFGPWLRQRLAQRLIDRRVRVLAGQLLPQHLALEAARQGQILSATLYLFELNTSDGVTFHKVGRTRRPVGQRLAEVVRDMTSAYQSTVSGKTLKTIEHAGYVEKYTLWKYRSSLLEIGRYHEYLRLAPADLRNLKSELTRFAHTRAQLSESEAALTAGIWHEQLVGDEVPVSALGAEFMR